MHTNHSFGVKILITGAIFLGFSFCVSQNSPVKGSVVPSNAGIRAWLLSKTDTLSAPVIQGNFTIDHVKPGNYTLMVEGKPPYRNTLKQSVIVVEGLPTDVGVIQMNQ